MSDDHGRRTEPGFSTRAIHHGYDPELFLGALTPPIFMTSAYAFSSAEKGQELFEDIDAGFRYGRYANPTQDLLERRLANLEGGEAALATASGMAAIAGIVWTLLEQGDEIVVDRTLYGATFTLFVQGFKKFGGVVHSVDMTEPANLKAVINGKTKLVYFETPGNPNLQIIDIAAVSEIAHQFDATVVVDNTFASPALQKPLTLGADLVVHSATKYLGGHGDLVAGAVIGSKKIIHRLRAEGMRFYTGATISPLSAFLVLRGLKTLEIRMKRHSLNAGIVANALETHPKVSSVIYPGLESTPNHELACKQMSGCGGMISFEVVGGMKAGISLMNNLRMIRRAVSLGDAETLIQHPASMTHSTYRESERKQYGISDGTVRLSVGLEDADDIMADLDQALGKDV
jgi:methionine-gamma-lyase